MGRKLRSSQGAFVVVKKNPRSDRTKRGKVWAVDGLRADWKYLQAEGHVKRCEYDSFNIQYRVIELDELGKYIPAITKKAATLKDDHAATPNS